MHYIHKPNNWNQWVNPAFNKINKTIKSCTSVKHLDSTRNMVNTFIVITALEEDVLVEDLEMLTRLFWFRLELQTQLILKQK